MEITGCLLKIGEQVDWPFLNPPHSFISCIILHRYVKVHKLWKISFNLKSFLQFPDEVKPQEREICCRRFLTVNNKLAVTHQTTGNDSVFEASCLWNETLHLLHGSQPKEAPPQKIFCSNTMWAYQLHTPPRFGPSYFQKTELCCREVFEKTPHCSVCSGTSRCRDCPSHTSSA